MPRTIIVGQRVNPVKLQRAKQLRRKMTAAEVFLWDRLRGNHLHGLHFRRQQAIDGFIVDFYCHSAGLAVEIDGNIHQQRNAYDDERDRALAQRGIRTLRVTNTEVEADLLAVLGRIARACSKST